MTQLKSLAHPEWPYTGTPNEWRGFAKDAKKTTEAILEEFERRCAVYQKQSFGPELK